MIYVCFPGVDLFIGDRLMSSFRRRNFLIRPLPTNDETIRKLPSTGPLILSTSKLSWDPTYYPQNAMIAIRNTVIMRPFASIFFTLDHTSTLHALAQKNLAFSLIYPEAGFLTEYIEQIYGTEIEDFRKSKIVDTLTGLDFACIMDRYARIKCAFDSREKAFRQITDFF